MTAREDSDLTPRRMSQAADYPVILEELIQRVRYRDNWTFELKHVDRGQGSSGLTLVITARVPNSYARHESISVAHYMPVPPAAYDERSWRRWLFEQILLVECHEAMEFFTLLTRGACQNDTNGDGDCAACTRNPDAACRWIEERPYAPSHGPGNDPYMIREPDGTELDRRTLFTGEVADH